MRRGIPNKSPVVAAVRWVFAISMGAGVSAITVAIAPFFFNLGVGEAFVLYRFFGISSEQRCILGWRQSFFPSR